jgi:hypothetical protein
MNTGRIEPNLRVVCIRVGERGNDRPLLDQADLLRPSQQSNASDFFIVSLSPI